MKSSFRASALLFLSLLAEGRAEQGSVRGQSDVEPDRRTLLKDISPQHFFALSDPRTEVDKPVVSSKPGLSAEEMPRPLNILSFGTSQTYGHGLEDRSKSYPYLITPYPEHVDNLALPATAADHPSLCLESMIPMADEKNYDLILFEYPSNQSDGLRLLLKRLRERYPKAIIMWVHVWHFVGRAREAGTGKTPGQLGLDPEREWVWKDGDTFSAISNKKADCIREVCHMHEMMKLLAEVDAVPFLMEQVKTPQEILKEGWFAEDWHHLSQAGHQKVANGIAYRLKNYEHEDLWKQAFSEPKPLGSWALGDKCFNWFYSGDVQVQYTGAKLQCINGNDPLSCTLNIDAHEGGEITFESDYIGSVPFAIGYITKGFPSVFPSVMVQVNDEPEFKVNPSVDRTTRVNAKSGSTVTSYIQAGYAVPGKNTIRITPLEQKELPFQLIGVYLCGACRQYQNDHMGLGALNMDNHGEKQVYSKDRLKGIMGYP